MWRWAPLTLAFGELRQEDGKFKAGPDVAKHHSTSSLQEQIHYDNDNGCSFVEREFSPSPHLTLGLLISQPVSEHQSLPAFLSGPWAVLLVNSGVG